MFHLKGKQILRTFLLSRPRRPKNFKIGLFTFCFQRQQRAGAQVDAFQRAVIVFTIVLCRRRWRRRPKILNCPVQRELVETSSSEDGDANGDGKEQ